jgi:molybdate transport system substrate-binding protein
MLKTRNGLVVLVFLLLGQMAGGQEITVAAASDLLFVMPEITGLFQKNTGESVKVVYGSSGNLFQQIQSGAPFDLFFSANLEYAKKLVTAGVAEPGSIDRYAMGKIVIWVPAGSKVDLAKGLAALAEPAVRKIAIANPEHAPYGEAAVAALKKENIYGRVADRLVLGENIAQAASFVVSGAADAGIIALSLAVLPEMKGKGSYVEIPAADYPAIEQGCVIVKASQKKEAARIFLKFVKTPAVASIFRRYGFGVP